MPFKINPFSNRLDEVSDGIPSGDIPIDFIGNTGLGASAVLNNLNVLGAGGISVDASGDTLTITGASASNPWTAITASQTLAVNNGYFCVSAGGALSLALPATSAIGESIEVSLNGATSFTVTQAAGQQIRLGNLATTLGATGTLASTAQGDSIRLVCRTANTLWVVVSSMGNLTIV